MRVRLTVKLADQVEGIDLSQFAEGDVIALPETAAKLLILGGWATPAANEERVSAFPNSRRAIAADRK